MSTACTIIVSIKTVDMLDLLKKLGLNSKQIDVYLALLELGSQPASVIAKKINLPKSTVLFLLDQLDQKGIVLKSYKGKTQFFYADIKDLSKSIKQAQKIQNDALEELLPLLNEFKSPFTSKPKLNFYQGVENCKKAYLQILETQGEFLEFGNHKDLVEKFGKKFMDNFISQRIKLNITNQSISNLDSTHTSLLESSKNQKRKLKLVPESLGNLYSSICIYDDKVLILNLHSDSLGILIQNAQFAMTMKTIFKLSNLGLS